MLPPEANVPAGQRLQASDGVLPPAASGTGRQTPHRAVESLGWCHAVALLRCRTKSRFHEPSKCSAAVQMSCKPKPTDQRFHEPPVNTGISTATRRFSPPPLGSCTPLTAISRNAAALNARNGAWACNLPHRAGLGDWAALFLAGCAKVTGSAKGTGLAVLKRASF